MNVSMVVNTTPPLARLRKSLRSVSSTSERVSALSVCSWEQALQSVTPSVAAFLSSCRPKGRPLRNTTESG
jgi:hypothetical protein